MGRFSRSEVESAFAEFYKVGCVDEDWTTWARMFTEECDYVEHFWGRMTKRSEVELWIN
ncbi:MAG: nuclear transport factor 2 family protein, partial [Deltaproteobacteria bacterium]|nr:nuclear transport factor 2 family protein [Deltaproteobacteria bacterium]